MIWVVGWLYLCGMCVTAMLLYNILLVRWHRWVKVMFWPLTVTYAIMVAIPSAFSKG